MEATGLRINVQQAVYQGYSELVCHRESGSGGQAHILFVNQWTPTNLNKLYKFNNYNDYNNINNYNNINKQGSKQ